MSLEEAIQLIARDYSEMPQSWVDLGCGKGLFTYALASYLPRESNILAVDQTHQHLHGHDHVDITFERLNFEVEDLPFDNLDGVLMANSLHYVKDQAGFIDRIKRKMKPSASFVIVEYDTDRANRWVPYPVSFDKSQKLFTALGSIQKLREKRSIYGSGILYACEVKLFERI